MLSDPVADLLSQIRNGYRAGKAAVAVPWSNFKEELAGVLASEGYLANIKMQGEEPGKRELVLELRYTGRQPVLTEIKRISRPGRRVYVGKKNLPVVLGGRGVAVVSTPAGVMTAKEAKKRSLGGEVICAVW
jgi:small subunit ribosomal protein S8